MARLGDVCEKITDYVASGSFAALKENVLITNEENYAIMVKTADFSNGFTKGLTYTDRRGYDFLKNSNLFGGELILSNIGSIGKVFKVPYLNRPMTLASNTVMIKTSTVELTDYLYYYFLSPAGYKSLLSISSGTSMLKFNKTELKKLEVPVPDLYKQRCIIAVMDKISKLISLRKQQLAKLDELVKARFVELFGDPVTNPKGWDMPLIEDVVANEKNALKAGPFGSALKKEYYVSSGYKIYGQEQVISGDHTFGDYYIDEKRYKMLENCAVQAGDVLISLVGTYGKLLVMPEEFEPGIINPRLMKITFDKKRVNPYYFQHYFQSDSLKKALAENTHGGTMDILNLGIVRKLAMPLPPLALQNEFISFVKQTDKSKLAIQQSLDKLETLKKSLMQKYFG